MVVKTKDFIEIEYTGKLKEDNTIFDTTDEKIAKSNNLYNENAAYGPITICVGENQILAGFEKKLEGKEAGKSYTVELTQDEAFGRKNPKLIQLISTHKFKQQKIQPMPGLQVFIDGMLGTVKTVSGGRTLVDFNHPLSGKDISYDVKINKVITDDKEKIEAYLKLQLNLKKIDVEVKENEANIKLKKEVPKEIQEELTKKITELTAIKKLNFIVKEKINSIKN